MYDYPVVALCTARGSGAIALIRVTGNGAIATVDRCGRLSSGKTLALQASHTIHHGFISGSGGEVLDEVLFLLMKGPKTFTGEDTVEITTHNNSFIIDKVIARLIEVGAQPARPGDFTQMAFLNGKLDLAKAEALHEVISAQSEQSLKIAMAQLQGSLSSYCAKIEALLVELLCYTEASFEFLDEEQRDLDFDNMIRAKLTFLKESVQQILMSIPAQEQIRQGVRIALIGSVNAGKSTLFNALIGSKRAIVSDQEGTTRDSIEATKYHQGIFWTFIDTAGLRQTSDAIEQQGIERSFVEAKSADLILLVVDSSQNISVAARDIYQELCRLYHQKIILVQSKADIALSNIMEISDIGPALVTLRVSSAQNSGIDALMSAIENEIKMLFASKSAPFLLNTRQRAILQLLEQHIQSMQSDVTPQVEYELLAYHVKDALERLSELTGKNVNEQMLDHVFRSFCIGK